MNWLKQYFQVVKIDIANDPVSSGDYKPSEDPTKFKSEKTGRGPLTGCWVDAVDPVMTCYKLVTCEFKWFGLQTRVENFIQKSERRLFTVFHRWVECCCFLVINVKCLKFCFIKSNLALLFILFSFMLKMKLDVLEYYILVKMLANIGLYGSRACLFLCLSSGF